MPKWPHPATEHLNSGHWFLDLTRILTLTAKADVGAGPSAPTVCTCGGSDGPTAGEEGRSADRLRTSAHILAANSGFMSAGLLIFQWLFGRIKPCAIKGDARCPAWDQRILRSTLPGIRSSAVKTPDSDLRPSGTRGSAVVLLSFVN